MASEPVGPATPTTSTPASEDWAARVTGLIATGVELVRDKSVRPAFIVASVIVTALSVAGTAVALVVLITVGLTRLFNDLVFSGEVWATYLLVGGIFALSGAFLILLGNRVARSEA